jgi:hypothetical protein
MTPVLRIFSYLPNPRSAEAKIVARLCGIEVEIRGAPVNELSLSRLAHRRLPRRHFATFPRARAHFGRLLAHPAIAPDLGRYLEALPLR